MKRLIVRKDSYHDSVFLMLAAKELKAAPGVREAVVAMGTDMNRDLLDRLGFGGAELTASGPNDLVVAVDASDEKGADAALAQAFALIDRKKTASRTTSGMDRAPTLESAVEKLPGAKVAVISLPGAYAAREARKALEKGLHVMLFSDNVSLRDEVDLKRRAQEKGLLVMGPDCGTAILDGQPLCFANAVRRGAVGLVGASGTGLQEVTCLLDRYGAGISQAIGTGGRDLKAPEVGCRTTLAGIAALARDPATKVIVVISKPPAPDAAARVLDALSKSGKPCVAHFVGGRRSDTAAFSEIRTAESLEECARMAAALARGEPYRAVEWELPEDEIRSIVEREAAGLAPAQKHLRGLFTGGTLADEALFLLQPLIGPVWSNNQTDPKWLLPDPRESRGHTIVDLGDDVFTVGRPHPMIDPSSRVNRIEKEADDPSVALLLLDLVLGYGSHPDPAGALAQPLARARAKIRERGGNLSIVASITGTPRDFQDLAAQRRKLEELGAVVMPSNRQASRLAGQILGKGARA